MSCRAAWPACDVGPPPNNRCFGGSDSKEAQVQYVGIDWAYRRAAWCALREGGEIGGEGLVPADEDGLAKLALRLGGDVRACVEMMSGAVWVRDRLQAAGWEVEVADARKVKGLAPLACKTDKVDARVLAELCRRDLVPAVWLPSLDDRALRERLKRRMQLVRMRTMARNRIHGLLTQWGLKLSTTRLRQRDAMELLEGRGMPEVWRCSVAEALAVIDLLDERLAPLERELRPLAKADPRVARLETIRGSGRCWGSPWRQRSATSPASSRRASSSRTRAGRRRSGNRGRARAPARSQRPAPRRCAGPPSRPLSRPGARATPGTGSTWRPLDARARPTPARPRLLIAVWHVLSRNEPFKPCRRHGG